MSALEVVLSRAESATDRAAAVSRAAPPDPAVRVALAEACDGSDTVTEHAVGERVRAGLLAWDDVWRDPHALGPGAVRLVQRALVLLARDLGARCR